MPQMNGIEATRIIRREVPESAVILISQNDPIIVARQAAESGASGYFAKADLAVNLVTVMNRVVERQSSEKRMSSGVTTESSLGHNFRVPLESVISTPELKKRPSRSPDYQAGAARYRRLLRRWPIRPRTYCKSSSMSRWNLLGVSRRGSAFLKRKKDDKFSGGTL